MIGYNYKKNDSHIKRAILTDLTSFNNYEELRPFIELYCQDWRNCFLAESVISQVI